MKYGDYHTKSEFKAVPAGTHLGIITGFAFLGLQPGSPMYPTPAYRVAITVSFPGKLTEDGKDELQITQQYTLSTSKKSNLRKLIEAINGPFADEGSVKKFQFETLVGKAGLFSIIHKQKDDRVYANVAGVLAVPEGLPISPSRTKTRFFTPDLEPQRFIAEYNALPEFLRKKWDERMPEENRESTAEDAAV
jgi:hypothetical protein